MLPILAHEGASPETILKAERGVAFRGWRLVTACVGRLGTPPARHYDLAARSSLHGSGGNARDGSAAPGPKSPWWTRRRQGYGGLARPPKLQRRRVERREARVPPTLRDAGCFASTPAR